MPWPRLALYSGFVLQYAGALMLLFDYHASIGAIILTIFLAAATLLFQRYWSATDPAQQRVMRLSFYANICIVGGLLLVMRPSAPRSGCHRPSAGCSRAGRPRAFRLAGAGAVLCAASSAGPALAAVRESGG